MDIHIYKFPIIIISAPRTGSTALCKVLYNRYKHLPNFKEYMEPLLPSERYYDFYEDTVNKKNKNYVLKVQAGEMVNVPEEIQDTLSYNHCTTIFLRRRDVIAQYTSQYIANTRNIYRYEKRRNYPQSKDAYKIDNTCPADLQKIFDSILEIDYHLDKMKNLIYRKNIELFYEDLNFSEQDYYIPSLPCSNYDEIYNKINEINKKKRTGWFNNLTEKYKYKLK